MKTLYPINELRQQHQQFLKDLDVLEEVIMPLNLPGTFVVSSSSRLEVNTLEDLHLARKILRDAFGWRDELANKFYSYGTIIATYQQTSGDTPLEFKLWLSAPPETFPPEVLGNCQLVLYNKTEYQVVCKVD